MQVQRPPASIHKELDRYVRRCVWGEFDSKKKVHLVSSEVVCRSKDEGGFGLRRAEGMNMALLARLCWRLLLQSETMWAKTLKKKYGLSETGLVIFKHKQRASPTWRGLEWASELFRRVSDGKHLIGEDSLLEGLMARRKTTAGVL